MLGMCAWLAAFCCEVVVAAVRMVVGGGDSQPWYSATNPYLQFFLCFLFVFVFPLRHFVFGVLRLLLLLWVGGGGGMGSPVEPHQPLFMFCFDFR